MEVLNTSVRSLHGRINRFIEEMLKCSSANASLINAYDRARLLSYLSSLRHFHDFILAELPLDLPETSPKTYPLRPNPEVPIMENEMINDIVEKFQLMRDELANSQSARLSSGLISFDSTRFLSYVSNIENFVSLYVDTASPLDLPESSPRAESIIPGKQGI